MLGKCAQLVHSACAYNHHSVTLTIVKRAVACSRMTVRTYNRGLQSSIVAVDRERHNRPLRRYIQQRCVGTMRALMILHYSVGLALHRSKQEKLR